MTKNKFPIFILAGLLISLLAGFTIADKGQKEKDKKKKESGSAQIEWISFEEAEARMKKKPKKIFVDVYTDWCGWCKKMDRETFANPEIAEYVNKNYYAVKFNAEGKEPVTLKGRTYELKPGYKTHDLAIELLNGKLGYPTTVYIDEDFKVLSPQPGYLNVEQFDKILRFYGDNNYKKQTYAEFEKSYSSKK